MLEVKNLCKNYKSFSLKNVSFTVPDGYIVGFIGRNGAGKTTTLKCIMNAVKPDGGEVNIFGKPMQSNECELKQDIGFALGEADYYKTYKLKTITDVYKKFYKNWNEGTYAKLLKKFDLDEDKRISQLSSGMKVKYALTLALSHEAKLFLFDEPTSGLDPVAKDELLDLFQSIVEDGEHSILFSTHITSDLDKIADYVVFIADGKIIVNDTKENVLASHRLVTGKKEDYDEIHPVAIGTKKTQFSFTSLVRTNDVPTDEKYEIAAPNLEDIMVYYNKESNV